MDARHTDIQIASAEPADSSDIVRMLGELAEHQGDPATKFDADAADRDLFGEAPWMWAMVAKIRHVTCGTVMWHLAYETSHAARGAYIESLWVDPPFRRRGIAKRLVGGVARRVAAKGGTYVWWASKPWNREAHATYASMKAITESVFVHALVGDAFQDAAKLET